jgi:signal transduction histidine kinase
VVEINNFSRGGIMTVDSSKFKLKIYQFLSRFSFFKNYAYKFYAITLLGILIPVLTAIGIWKFFDVNEGNTSVLVTLILVITLGSIVLTLFIQRNLIEPLLLTETSLDDFIVNKRMSNLPTNLDDDIGRLMRKVQYSVKSIDELHKEKKDMLDIISIDLRNKITAVYNYSEMITQADTDEKKQNLKTKIAAASLEQIELIDSVKGMLEMEEVFVTKSMKEEIELEEMFNSIKEQFADEIHRKQLSIELLGDIKLINGKEALLKQAFTNLISNAIKYSNVGGEIVVNSSRIGTNTLVKVIDKGVGFTTENKDLIFDRFTKVRRRGTTGESTTGLGLYLSRKIIDKHSGTIEANSQGEGKGAEFTVSLPD